MAPIDVTILKVTDPSHFWAKEVPGPSMTPQARQFLLLCQDIDEYCSSDQFQSMHVYQAKKGMVCLARKMQTDHWYRARVTSIIHRKYLEEASCVLLDYGESIRVPTSRMRDIPASFLDVPFQAREYALYDLLPLTLKVSFEEDQATMQPTTKWDTAAVEYFEEMLAGKPAKIDIHHTRQDGVSLVTLYVSVDLNQVNVNEELLKLDYATKGDVSSLLDGSISVTPEKTRSPRYSSSRRSLSPSSESDVQSTTSRRSISSPPTPPMASGSDGLRLKSNKRSVPSPLTSPLASDSERQGLDLETTLGGVVGLSSQQHSQHGQPVTKSPKQLLSQMMALMENTKKTVDVPPSARNLSTQALTQPSSKSLPSARNQSPQPLTKTSSQTPVAQTSPDIKQQQQPREAASLRLKTPSPFKVVQTNKSGATRLPFAVGGKFSLMPEEMDSLKPGQTICPPAVLSSVRKTQERRSGFSSDPDYYNSSSDEPTQYMTPVIPQFKVIGQRLLNQISSGSKSVSSSMEKKQVHHQLVQQNSGILIHGDRPPAPMLTIEDSFFPQAILQKLTKLGYQGPSAIQAYSWPSILRGRDTVGISAPGTGKSLAFLLPLIAQTMQPTTYSSLPPGNGPLVIVVCPRWRQAAEVYDQCERFLPSQRGSKVILIHGGGSEEDQEVQLMNGCSVLVATLPCLLRMIKGEHASLRRLSHLVFDDADILCEDYTSEVKQLMGDFGSMLSMSDSIHRTAPRQLVLFASQWTMAMGSFVRSYMSDPIFACTFPLEAAVYARVRQVVLRVEPDGRAAVIRSLLESRSGRVVIFTNKKEDAQKLQKLLLGGYCYYTLLAFKDMPRHHLEAVMKEWHTEHKQDSLPILVCTDDACQDLGITDASTVVHFDFPPSKQKFGQRLSTMMDHFSSQLEKSKVSDCKSILLISKEHTLHSPGLANLLSRCSFTIPTLLRVEEAIMEKEMSKKSKSLCHQLKAFGRCRNEKSCTGRHQVFSDLDTPGSQANHLHLPPSGIVKILVTHVVDASNFYARILEYRNTEASDAVAMPTTHLDLAFDLALWFSDPNHKEACSSHMAGDLCVIEDGQHVYHRVRVQRSKRTGSSMFEEEKEVQYIDQGRTERVPVSKLLRLPDHLSIIPHQVVEIVVCRIKPLDGDTDWTTQAGFFVHNKIHDKQLEGKIILNLNNTLWVDPLVQRVHLPSLQTTVNIHNIRQELLEEGYAEDNPEHITNLRKRCEGRLTLPDLVTPSGQEHRSQPILLPDPIYLKISDEFYTVYVSSVHTPGCLYIQLASYAKRLENLMEEINAKCQSVKTAPSQSKDWQPKVGEVCLAKFHEDERWNRVSIREISGEGKYEVFYLDFGDQEEVSKEWIRPAWNTILQLPFQAIKCSLTNIRPHQGADWSDGAGDALWDMCLDGDSKKLLMVKVVSEKKQDAECIQYEIELFDTSSERDIVIGQQLVYGGHASGTESFLEAVFPTTIPDDDTEVPLTTEAANQLSHLCSEIFQMKNLEEQLESAKQIKELMMTICELDYEVDVTPLCQLLVSMKDDQLLTDTLATGLVYGCFKKPKNCEVVCRVGGLHQLCRLLLKTDDAGLQEFIPYILMMSSGSNASKKSIQDYGGIQALCRLLDQSVTIAVINQASSALASLVADNTQNQEVASKAGGLKSLCKLLGIVKDKDCLMNMLRALSKMAAHLGNRDLIREEGGLTVLCDFLWETRDSPLVHIIAQALSVLSSNNMENLQAMAEQQMLDCVECQLMCMSHSQSTHQLLSTLHVRLINYTKKHMTTDVQADFSFFSSQSNPPSGGIGQSTVEYQTKVIDIHEIKEGEEPVIEEDLNDMPPLEYVPESALPRLHPKVLWSQRSNSVVLSVQLRGVQTYDIKLTSTSISFSTLVDATMYEFKLNLYGRVRAPDHTAVPSGSEVLITLYKESVGSKWSRLAANKSKLPYIGVDFERWNEESDSDDEVEARFGIKKKTSHPIKPKMKKTPSNKIPIASVPELDTSESSNSEYELLDSSEEGAEFSYASDENNDPLSQIQSSSQ
ncbi:uncharacterized protein LOC117289469 [Asterias rubens]|uniref:uncharacterized protein LOC117289469 n=1 Tax=Asterias rubens TaxID=7604 RepID=UPI001455A973|nr:uncharacterized protein LOC117289469 [Asterias rubens]